MIYCLIGEDVLKKDSKIAEIKQKALSADSYSFDYEVLYGNKLDSQQLRKSLLTLPAISKQRLVVIREGHKLSLPNRKILSEFIKTKPGHLSLVIDFQEEQAVAGFLPPLGKLVSVIRFESPAKPTVFSLTDAISARRQTDALKLLYEILEDGAHPLQVMGALIWFWGKSKIKMRPERFEQGLKDLQEADLNIKRSRLKPEQAVEVLVVKLSMA